MDNSKEYHVILQGQVPNKQVPVEYRTTVRVKGSYVEVFRVTTQTYQDPYPNEKVVKLRNANGDFVSVKPFYLVGVDAAQTIWEKK